MDDCSIEGLMKTTMESIREMVDVNTIVGDAVHTPDGTVIIPISKVTFGFAAGGGSGKCAKNATPDDVTAGFGGGSGAGVSVRPVGFLVCSVQHGVKFMQVEGTTIYEKLFDLFPQAADKLQELLANNKDNKSTDHGEQTLKFE